MHRWVSLLPLLAFTAYFLVALLLYSLAALTRGARLDAEVADHPGSRLIGRYLRHYLMWVLSPYERALIRCHVKPNHITLASLLCAAASGACLWLGHFAVGGWLFLVAGILDILDGRVARGSGKVTVAGAFFDSVIDRYAELCVFAGLAFYYRASWALAAVLLCTAGSMMVSYVRARGEALGVDAKVGVMQRPERVLYLGVVIAHSPLLSSLWPEMEAALGASPERPLYPPTVAALLVLGLLANLTAVGRIRHAVRLLDARAEPAGGDPLPSPTTPTTPPCPAIAPWASSTP